MEERLCEANRPSNNEITTETMHSHDEIETDDGYVTVDVELEDELYDELLMLSEISGVSVNDIIVAEIERMVDKTLESK